MESFANKTNIIEDKIHKIEESHNKAINEILNSLNSIKTTLVGDLNVDNPGLFSDVRDLKREIGSTKVQLESIARHVEEIRTSAKSQIIFEKNCEDFKREITELRTEITSLKNEIESLKKYRFLMTGAIIVITWILSKTGDIVALIKK